MEENRQQEQQQQQEEMMALSSIYGDDLVFVLANKRGSLLIQVNLSDEFYLHFQQNPGEARSIHVSFLPPLHITFDIPDGYPAEKPPTYSLRCMWINTQEMKRVKEKLHTLWQEGGGDVVLFTWFQFLSNDLIEFLHLTGRLNVNDLAADKTATDDGHSATPSRTGADRVLTDLLSALFEYDETRRQQQFESSVFECSICVEPKAGVDCIQLKPCLDVFCKICLKAYYEVQITDGNVTSLTCPQKGCQSTAIPQQVEKLVSKELFVRYDTLLLRRCLDTMADVVYCPRAFCQAPAVVDSKDNLAVCSVCSFAFCATCKRLYHGVEECEETRMRVTMEYLEGDDATRAALKAKHGHQAFFQRLEREEKTRIEMAEAHAKLRKENYKTARLSAEYVKNRVKSCPTCHYGIEKVGGCNRVCCIMCSNYMCWGCGKALESKEGYNHFHTAEACPL